MSWRPPYFADHTIARGSSGGGGQQQTTQQVVLPDWLQAAGSAVGQHGADPRQSRLHSRIPDESVAPLTPDQTQAYSEIEGMQGGTQPAYQTAENAATGLLSGAQPLTAAGIGADATTLMNPYTSAVVDPSVALMRQQLAQTTQGIDANAANVGAFGGSRQGVEEGTAQSQEALQAGQLAGGLLQSGYGQALTTAQGIAQANQQAGEWATGELPALATQEAGQTATEAGLLDEAGREQQGQAQAQSDLAASQWQERYDRAADQPANSGAGADQHAVRRHHHHHRAGAESAEQGADGAGRRRVGGGDRHRAVSRCRHRDRCGGRWAAGLPVTKGVINAWQARLR